MTKYVAGSAKTVRNGGCERLRHHVRMTLFCTLPPLHLGLPSATPGLTSRYSFQRASRCEACSICSSIAVAENRKYSGAP